jgi:hypothetical protein
MRRADAGVTVVAGADFTLGRSDFTLDARFTWGFIEPCTGLRLRNRAVSLGAGVAVPLLTWWWDGRLRLSGRRAPVPPPGHRQDGVQAGAG